MLRKTLIGLAVTAINSANAGEIIANGGADSAFTNNPWQLISAEGLAIAKSIDIGTDAENILVGIELEADYYETDLLVITISGAEIADAFDAKIDGTSFEFIGVDADAGTVVFRHSRGSSPIIEFVPAGTYSISGITLTPFSGLLSISSFAQVCCGLIIDRAEETVVAVVQNELTVRAGTTTLNAVINVEKMRKEFIDGLADNFTIAVTSGADLLPVTPTSAMLTLTGDDLDFLNNASGELNVNSYTFDGVIEDETKTTLVGNTLSVTSVDAYGASFGLTLNADGIASIERQPLIAQSFFADVNLDYTYNGTGGARYTFGLDVGRWELDGVTINVPYMPCGNNISQIIYLSNDGSVEGDIELTAFDDKGNQYGPLMLPVTATAKGVTSLAQPIRNALLEEGFDGTGRVDFTLVVNSPEADIEVYAAYNVAGDRATVTVL